MPRRYFTSGRKFSTSTSAPAANRFRIASPSGAFRFSVRLRLLRCRFWKSGPSRAPPSPSSTPGLSTLMTSAPQSANCFTQVGPARTRVRSRTRKRERGPSLMDTYSLAYLFRRCKMSLPDLRRLERDLGTHGEGQNEAQREQSDRADERQLPIAREIDDEAKCQ